MERAIVIEFRISQQSLGDSTFEYIQGKLFLAEISNFDILSFDGATIVENKGYIGSVQNMIPIGKNALGFMRTIPAHVFIETQKFFSESLKIACEQFPDQNLPIFFYNKKNQIVLDESNVEKLLNVSNMVDFLKLFTT